MTRSASPLAGYLLFAIALAWPLDLYQYVPILDTSVTGIATLLLVLALAWDLRSGQKLRVPFEILWPVAALACLLGVMAYRHTILISGDALAALFLFVATAHFADSRRQIERWLWGSAASGTLVVMLALLGPRLGLMPTAYAVHSRATLTFAYDMTGGAHIIALSLIVVAYMSTQRALPPALRALTTLATLLGVCVFVVLGLQTALGTAEWRAPSILEYPRLVLTALLVTLWLFARVAAKVEVHRRETARGVHLLFWTFAVLTFVFLMAAPLQPRPFHGYLLGLACGYSLPERSRTVGPAWPKAASVLLLALVAINAAAVFPAHLRDPRNYEAAARDDFSHGRYDTLLRRMDYIERHAPGERRTHLWRARTALERGDANAASMEFSRSLDPADGERRLLTPPGDTERTDFLVQLRDYTSTLTEAQASCSYERALIANGERDTALYALQVLAAVPLVHVEDTPNEPIAAAVAAIIGDPTLRADFMAWSPDELLTLLVQWGATVEKPPDGFPRARLPAVFISQRTMDSNQVFIGFGGEHYAFQDALPPPAFLPSEQGRRPTIAWGPLVPGSDGRWSIGLNVRRPGASWEIGAVHIGEEPRPKYRPATSLTEEIPFTPAISVYLP